MPTLFTVRDAIVSEHCKGIVKNKRSRLKRQAMVLALVDPVVFVGPIQTASLYKMDNTPGGWTERRLKGVISPNPVSREREPEKRQTSTFGNRTLQPHHR